jgi:prepilin-type N-terminal cleavage/methylation domain-containing protein
MKKILTSQRGDTLIEVTMALAILAVVLLSATLITTRAFRLGQTARERTMVAEAAQVQAEALRSFRDNRTWTEFLNGGSIGGVSYNGVLNGDAAVPVGCKSTATCFHMAPKALGPGASEYVPTGGAVGGSVPTSYIEIAVTPNGFSPPTSVDVVVSYGFVELGGTTQNLGHIKTTLTNIGLKP